MTEKVIIWGASGHGRVVLDAARACGNLSVVGFLDDDASKKGQMFSGCPILGGRELLSDLRDSGGVRAIHVAVGHCAMRLAIAESLSSAGFSTKTIVHPAAVIASDTKIGSGSFVAAGAIMGAGAAVGREVIVNTNSSVDHDCLVGDGVHIAPGVRLGGLVNVGRGTFIGIGATVINCLAVGENTIVGAGAVVVRDLPPGIVAYGVPAKVI